MAVEVAPRPREVVERHRHAALRQLVIALERRAYRLAEMQAAATMLQHLS